MATKSLWTDWIKEHIIQKGSFWQATDQNSRGSWIWSKLLKYMTIALDFHRMAIGKGDQTFFWFDHWSSLGRLWTRLGSAGIIHMGIPRNCRLHDIPRQRRRRNHRNEFLNLVENELSKFDFESTKHDQSVWRSRSGVFKTKLSTQDTWEQLRTPKAKVPWHKGIWFKHNTPKFSFIAWVAILDRLTTGDKMRKWNGNITGDCCFCQTEVETVKHLFFECSYTKSVWEALMKKLLGGVFSNSWVSLLGLLANCSGCKVKQFLFYYGFQSSLYLIWRERNRRRHGGHPSSEAGLVKVIDTTIRSRIGSVQGEEPYLAEAMELWMKARDY